MWANNDSDTADFFVDGAVDGGAGGGEGGGPSRLPALVPYWLHAGRPPGEKKEARFGLGSRARVVSVGADIKRVFSVLVRCGGLREGRKMLKGKEGQKARDRRDGALAKSAGEKLRQEAGGSKEMTDQLSSNPSCSVLHQSNSISTE